MLTSEVKIMDIEPPKVTTALKVRQYWLLLKPRLSFLVAFSAAFGYLFALEGNIHWGSFIALSLGGFLITGSSVIINQILEKSLDAKMNRTSARPLPTEKLSIAEASTYGFLVGLVGLSLLLIFTNTLTAFLALCSVVLYGFVYTPLKKMGPIAVIVGAIPGALPPLLGWVAFQGNIGFEAFILFTLQFVWQFPHFWAIAWVSDEDYAKAGFRLLPSKEGRGTNSAIQILLSALFLIPVGCIPYQLGMSGITSAWIAVIMAIFFCIPAGVLVFQQNRKRALQVMFASFIYLPIVQIAYLLDKI